MELEVGWRGWGKGGRGFGVIASRGAELGGWGMGMGDRGFQI